MVRFVVQNGESSLKFGSGLIQEDHFSCPGIWNPIQARFEKCALPYISAIPAVVTALIVVVSLLRILLPWRVKFPQWTRNIIKESIVTGGEPLGKRKHPFTQFTIKLLVLSIIGFLLQLVTVLHPKFRFEMIFPATSWAVGGLIIAINRPTRTPKDLLTIYLTLVLSQACVLIDTAWQLQLDDIPNLLAIITCCASIYIIVNMPLRDPLLSLEGVSLPFGTPGSHLRSPEDNLTLWQFMTVSWMSPLIRLAKTKQLDDEDVWSLAYEFQHKLLSARFKELKGTVMKRLIDANGVDLFIITALAFIELFANFSAPILLQKILQSMENKDSPKQAALTYAMLSLLVRLVAAQCSVFGLWYGRRCYERSRGELIVMLYEKTLSRKVVSISARPQLNEDKNGVKSGEMRGKFSKVVGFLLAPYRACCGSSRSKKPKKDLATMGKILNLMRFDAYEVAQRFWEFSTLITIPFGIILSVVLVWKLIGWPCLAGAVTIVFAQAFNALIARIVVVYEKKRRTATDVKLHKVSQLVESIRHLRWYGWQNVWLARIMEARKHELKLRVIASLWRSIIFTMNRISSHMFPVVAFYAYTVWAGLPLRVDIAFPALQLFNILETSLAELPNLITVLLNAKVSIDRIDGFMNEPDKLDAEMILGSSSRLEIEKASFSWPGATDPVLKDITLSFNPGLSVIFGKVGAGKSALLQALLGEADLITGEYHRSNEMVGYCAQTPWLQSMSIRENILFSTPYDSVRYRDVLEACALIPDMAQFPQGDLSLVGENGVGLSGGQKARISLARAVYSQSRILFLDDPLSALDHQTAETIVRRCIKGPLLEGRTTLLVTHRVDLCLDLAEQVIEIQDGHANVLDPRSISSNELTRINSAESVEEQDKADDLAAIPDKFMEDEHRAHGGVMLSVYWEYIKAGKFKYYAILIVFLCMNRIMFLSQTWFLKQWGEAYNQISLLLEWNPFKDYPSPEVDVRPWLVGFFLLAIGKAISVAAIELVSVFIVYEAGKSLFERIMEKCTYATFQFYDHTPVGRLMNRLTSDVSILDGNLSAQLQNMAYLSIAWIVSIVIIASVTPVFLIVAIVLTIAFVFIFSLFLPASQSLRRLEMVSLTPLISNFGALAEGLITIRAYCSQYRFGESVKEVTDKFQKMDHFYWSLQAWLLFRFDTLSASSTFLLTALALSTGVSPGLTAFLLTGASQFVSTTHDLCKTYGKLQMDFVSVERVIELLHLEQEPPGTIDPPAYWPRFGGDIVFEDVTIKYAPHLDPALSNVSLTIKGGSTTALIGRTGSGKSTLALSLLATILPTSGRILIDGIDVSTVNTQALRKRITFLAQEPVLFPGTLHQNLDPLSEFSTADCISVLNKVASRHAWTLDMHIDTGGKNLSQGQRQLVGLARALLRRSAIVIMDEATASIDLETALQIQQVLRDELSEATVVVIAHRKEAVQGAEWCVELARGKVVDVGAAGAMAEHVVED